MQFACQSHRRTQCLDAARCRPVATCALRENPHKCADGWLGKVTSGRLAPEAPEAPDASGACQGVSGRVRASRRKRSGDERHHRVGGCLAGARQGEHAYPKPRGTRGYADRQEGNSGGPGGRSRARGPARHTASVIGPRSSLPTIRGRCAYVPSVLLVQQRRASKHSQCALGRDARKLGEIRRERLGNALRIVDRHRHATQAHE